MGGGKVSPSRSLSENRESNLTCYKKDYFGYLHY